jgi:nitrite reductase (NADH) small subunit
MPAWIAVANSDELPPNAAREFLVGEKLIALFRVGDEFFALDAICPHQGGPLAKGAISGTSGSGTSGSSSEGGGCLVTCPWHGWQFDLKTGQQQIIRTIRQPTYPVKIEEGKIFVDIEAANV